VEGIPRLQGCLSKGQTSFDMVQARKSYPEIEKITNRMKILYEKIEKIDPDYVSLRNTNSVSIAQLQSNLQNDPDTILIEYYLNSNEVIIFLVTSGTVKTRRVKISRNIILDLVNRYHANLDALPNRIMQLNPEDLKNDPVFNEADTILEELGKYLLYPVIEDLTQIHPTNEKKIIFIPYGELHLLPLHALKAPDGHYLIEKYEAAYLPLSTLIQHFGQVQFNSKKNLACISLSAIPKEREQIEHENKIIFEDEAKQIVEMFDSRDFFSNVTKDQVRDLIESTNKKFDIIHFSCHAFYYGSDPLTSGLVLYDGELTAKDILNLQLPYRPQVVTLSACETGKSLITRGDELIGLPRAFLYAGALSVVVSLWPVSSIPTMELMNLFYNNIKTGKSKIQSLKDAQKIMIAKGGVYAHPFIWAPFVLVGHWG
jgi:CHAT domain-containing protein